MARNNIQIAPNYAMEGNTAQTLNEAMDHRIFTYRSKGKEFTPELMLDDDMLTRLTYLQYPKNIQGLVAAKNSPMDLLWTTLDNLQERQQMTPFYPKDTLGFVELTQQIRDGDMKHALASVMDFETITMKDAFGNEKNWIYNAGFYHIHSDATVGQFKKNQFQHLFIGIYDDAEMDYLTRIAEKAEKSGTRALSAEENVAFEFLSRFGHSMRQYGVTDLATQVPDNFLLTEASRDVFGTVDNFKLAQRALKDLGDKQIKDSRSGLVAEGIEQVIDNIVETLINKDSMITGWNVPYDTAKAIELVENVPGANDYFKRRIKELGFDPDDYNISDIRKRTYDPTNHLIYPSSGEAKRIWYNEFFGVEKEAGDIGTHAVSFDNWLKAMRKQYPNDPLFKDAHHLGGTDVLQEMAAIFRPDSSLVVFEDELRTRAQATVQQYNKNFAIQGLLFQAQDSGSMQNLHRFNKNVFATVESANGDIYTSSGWKYDMHNKKWIQADEYTPGAWKEGVTYELLGGDYIKKDSDFAKAISSGRPDMQGEDLVRIQMRVGLLDPSQQMSAMGQEVRSIYMPASMAARELGAHFRVIGEMDEQGNVVLNSFGKQQTEYIHKRVNGKRYSYKKDLNETVQAYKDMNDMGLLDRAERSFTKRKMQTNENAFLLRDILDTGTYESFSQHGSRAVQLQRAIQAVGRNPKNTAALENILKGTSVNKSAGEVARLFNIKDAFNEAWFSNTFTIADTMRKGSLYEQLHRTTLDIMKQYQKTSFASDPYYMNQLYTTIMDEGVRAVMAQIPQEKLLQQPGWRGRPVNDAYAYWLKAEDFLRKFRDEREVVTAANSAERSWIKLDLSSPVKVVSAIKRATGLTGAAAENDRLVKRNMIDFMDYLAKNGRIDAEAREEIEEILNDHVAQKSTYGLGADIAGIFQELKKRQRYWGWAPDEVLLEHDSFLTLSSIEDNAFTKKAMDPVTKVMEHAAKQQESMLVNFSNRKKEIESRLRHFMLGPELSGDKAYEKIIEKYGTTERNVAAEIYGHHRTAIKNYAHNLIESLDFTGIGISVGENSVHVNYGGKTIDISDLIPRLRANQGGALSWMLGENKTRYAATMGLSLRERSGTQLEAVSMLDWAQQQMFQKDGQHAQKLLRRAINTDSDPLSTLQWILRVPDSMTSQHALIKGAPAFDVRNMFYGELTPILENKNAIGRIIGAAQTRDLSAAQENAINVLTDYYYAWKGNHPTIGLDQENAILTLLSDDNPLLNPELPGAVTLNASAKQPGSDMTRVAFAQVGSVSENINDPGKMLSHQLDNALYFRTQRTKLEERILKEGNIKDLAFGPRFATATEQAIANVTENGIGLSNRVVLNSLEANDAVKTQIYDMLVQKYNNDKTVAAVFGSRFMPHEGGGLISSRIMDVLQSPLSYQKVTWKPSMFRDMNPKEQQRFTKNVGLQFSELADGSFEFTGYGRGQLVKKDDAAWRFYSRYFGDMKSELAKRDSILNVVYMTQNGGQIVDEATLKQNVEEAFKAKGKTSWSQAEWLEMADSMYDRKLVAQNIFDPGVAKLGVDSEKHESQNMARAISQFWDGTVDTGTQEWQKEEKLLRDIFYSKEFDVLNERLSTDFRTGQSLSAKWYYDIAEMKMASPLFGSRDEADAARALIRQKVGDAFNLTKLDDIDNKFFQMMDKSRHRLSDDIVKLTGANFLGKSIDQMTSHGNYDMILFSVTNWLEQQMQQNRGTIEMTEELRKQDFATAIQIINSTQAITDKSGRALSLSIDPVTGAAIIETDRWELNPNKLQNALASFGFTGDAAKNEMKRILSDIRDVPEPGRFLVHRAEARFLIDYGELDKLYKMSDRELISYTNTLFDDEIVGRLKSQMDEKTFKSLLGKYVDENTGKVKQEYIGKSMWGDALDAHFRDTAFMTPGKGKNKLIGGTLYNEKFDYGNDKYRADKTKDLVRRLAPESELPTHISQQYADNLYEYASLQQAARFNKGSIYEKELITDVGKTDQEFFKKIGIADVDTMAVAPDKKYLDPDVSMFKRNLLVNVTDSSIGLDEMTVGRKQIALAGLNLGDDEVQAEYQRKFQRLQEQYFKIKNIGRDNPEFSQEVATYRNLVNDIVNLQDEYATAGKIKTSLPSRLMKAEVAGSVNNKVNVIQTEHMDSSLRDFLSARTYKGENLADMYAKGKNVNFAVISEADLAGMGFTDEYFQKHAKDPAKWMQYKEDWLKRLETEGIGGRAHRWPSDYWGSTMSVQIYLDRNGTRNLTGYDAITAAFLKADSDGDAAQLVLNSTRNAKGEFIDVLSADMGSAVMDKSAEQSMELVRKNHALQMQVQILDTNQMVKRRTDYHKAYDSLYQNYKNKVLAGTIEDPLVAFGKKNPRMDLNGNIMSLESVFLNDDTKRQYRNAFDQYKSRITDAIKQAGGDENIVKTFQNASTADEAAMFLREQISTDLGLRDRIRNALGNDADAINEAFRNAASMSDAKTIALQRIARKGAGLADTPFTSMDFLRMNALAMDNAVITNSQNVAMDMVKELTKEQLLTPKKMDIANIHNITQNLNTLNTMLDDIMKHGKNNEALRNQFIDFIAGNKDKKIAGIARDPNSRYQAESLLSEFATEKNGERVLDMRKIAATAYDGYVDAIEGLRKDTDLFNVLRSNVMDTSRGFKGRIGILQALSNTASGRVNRAVATSNGIEEAFVRAKQTAVDEGLIEQQGKQALARRGANIGRIVEKSIKDFRPGKSLALSALTLAGAAVFGGYAGGNPSQPAQQQAQNIQEQNPPPRNINLADPSLTASNRKQAGYVININAQTQKDKEYASRLITQAVTRNFQDTNINVSMNVNQQPGNISGNDLMDYLTQAIY